MPAQKIQSKEAFTELFDQFWESLYDYAVTCTRQPELAQDLVQDLFAQIWIKRNSILVTDNWQHYLFRALKNRIIDAHRSNKINLLPLPEDDWFSTGQENLDAYESKLSLRTIHQLTNHLTPTQQRVFKLHRFQGFSIREIAHLLAVSENTVKSHIQESTKKIRSLFHF